MRKLSAYCFLLLFVVLSQFPTSQTSGRHEISPKIGLLWSNIKKCSNASQCLSEKPLLDKYFKINLLSVIKR
jgi:hypothetical protein